MSNSDEPLKKHYKYETVDGDTVIRDELDRLARRRHRAVDEELLPESAPTDSEAVSESLTGLALSGGGIRSGALGLGILQALHRSGLLPFFDYLSTVSGGGYAGSYLTSAGSQNRKQADDKSARSTSHDDTVPYGRLKAFHDGEGLSERMQQFIFGGHYLLRTRRFFNRHLMGLLSIWFMTITGLSTIAALAAYLFRELDQPIVRHFLGGLGFRTDVSRGFFPVTALLVMWCICWCISFFRASGNMAHAQGRAAAKLMPVIVVTFGICVASLLGNGEFSLEWVSSANGIDIAGLFSSAEKFFQFAIYGVIGVGLLPFLNPAALIRSGAKPKSTSDRVVFAIASRVLLYGLPFLLVSWFARENISTWTDHRFVPEAIAAAKVRDADRPEWNRSVVEQIEFTELPSELQVRDQLSGGSDLMKCVQPVEESGNVGKAEPNVPESLMIETRRQRKKTLDPKPEDWTDYVAVTRHEISKWNDWQPAWAPFWTELRAAAAKDKAARQAPARLADQELNSAKTRLEEACKSVSAASSALKAAKTKAEEAANKFAAAKKAPAEEADPEEADPEEADPEEADPEEADPEEADPEEADVGNADAGNVDASSPTEVRGATSIGFGQKVSLVNVTKDSPNGVPTDGVETARLNRDTTRAAMERAGGVLADAEAAVAAARKTWLAARKNAADVRLSVDRKRPEIAEYIWWKLNHDLQATAYAGELFESAIVYRVKDGDAREIVTTSDHHEVFPVEELLRQIHKESLALQELYSFSELNTDSYAPDSPRLIFNRLLSLVAYAPDFLRGAKEQNHLGEFVERRQRLALLRNTLADHLSRILETTNFGEDCTWPALSPSDKLSSLVEQARQMSGRHEPDGDGQEELSQSIDIVTLSKAERRQLAHLNREILDKAFPETLRDPSTVFAANVLEFDQARRWTMFWICLGFFLFGALMININATTLHGFYARELANNWIEADEDSDLPLSAVDATDQCLPYHILSGSVHWMGKRKKAKGDLQRDHFLLSPMYCGCEKTGFVTTARYKDDEIGLGDAIAISGGAVTPIQQGNPLLQAMLWLANLRLGQWLPNPNHGTFLPTKSRNIVERTAVTPMRLMWRFFQVAERRPFLFVTDGGHHENLGIGPLLKRRCRFILAVDAGEDADYAFSDLSSLMRWARAKHNVRLQPVDSQIEPIDLTSGGALATTVAGKTDVPGKVRSAIDAWNDLAPSSDTRLSPDRLSMRHFVVLRIHYPDVEGPSWLVFAKTSLTGDEPAELIRYAESDKKFPHNPTSNQFYAPDTFEAYRQLGEHIVDSMVGQLPSIIAGKMDEHEDRPEAPYLGGMLHQIDLARKTLPLNITAAPPTPESFELIKDLRNERGTAEVQVKLSKRLSIHPLFVSGLLHAALSTKTRLHSALLAFLFPELGPETSPARRIFTERRLPGRAEAMRTFKPKEDHVPEERLVGHLIDLAELLVVIPDGTPDFQHAEQMVEYAAVYQLLTNLRTQIADRKLKDKINRLPSEAKNPARKRKKTTRRRKTSDAPPVD